MSDPRTTGPARIVCPRCRSNNFAGKTHCWQCNASLPPPESVAAAPAPRGSAANAMHAANVIAGPAVQRATTSQSASHQHPIEIARGYPVPAGHTSIGKGTLAAMVLAVGAIAIILVWLIMGRLHGDSETAHPVSSKPTAIAAPSDSSAPSTSPAQEESDPLVAESKRFIERESRHAGLPEPPVSDDGQVHLRSGGSISAERYREVQRHVQESPVFHQPIPAPPMP